MANLNQVQIIGRLGRTPEVRYMPSGDPIANLAVATSEVYKDKEGVKQESTEWHRCVAFKQPANFIQQYAEKGDLVFIEGKLQTRDYEKDGVKHYSTEIVVSNFQLLSKKGAAASSSPSSDRPNGASSKADDDDDDKPPF